MKQMFVAAMKAVKHESWIVTQGLGLIAQQISAWALCVNLQACSWASS